MKLGAEVLQNVKGFVEMGGSDDIAKALDAHVKTLEDKKIGSVEFLKSFKKDMEKLNKNLARLNAIGGSNAIAPSEGVVFQYKGGTYKLTGTFAPINPNYGNNEVLVWNIKMRKENFNSSRKMARAILKRTAKREH